MGVSAARSGAYATLGTTVDGKLLVLGAEPSAGVSPDRVDPNGPPPRLWAWDTHTARWELAEERVPCQDVQHCLLVPSGFSMVVGSDGRLKGTMVWLSRIALAVAGTEGTQGVYRLFIPAD
jgi:hypothetical protein